MSRAYALVQLLAHGDLTMREIITITGWPPRRARQTVSSLSCQGRIVSIDGKWAN